MDAIAYWEPKLGTASAEWEDGVSYSPSSGWFCVTDGASTGGSSREWAFTLASAFTADQPLDVLHPGPAGDDAFRRWLGSTRARFDPRSGDFAQSRMPAWVQDTGAREGAFATLLGGFMEDGRVRLISVGDCCAFQLRGTRVTGTFPLTDADQFGSHPDVLGNVASQRDLRLSEVVRRGDFELTDGDELVVASDALSEWLLRSRNSHPAWLAVSSVGAGGFRDLCHDLRIAKLMKNDDVTLLRCRPNGGWNR